MVSPLRQNWFKNSWMFVKYSAGISPLILEMVNGHAETGNVESPGILLSWMVPIFHFFDLWPASGTPLSTVFSISSALSDVTIFFVGLFRFRNLACFLFIRICLRWIIVFASWRFLFTDVRRLRQERITMESSVSSSSVSTLWKSSSESSLQSVSVSKMRATPLSTPFSDLGQPSNCS